ncbi:MAG: homocysteine S-methyltransferase family protein [Chloroflexi bacterium]|nr:homocysteine S-methyltransferase family protein [Chloroflexota bacterium]
MSRVTVMDGGMGAELVRRGAISESEDGLWSAQALIDAPEAVVAAHRDFIAAGAGMIITNSYACVPGWLAKAGIADRYAELAAEAGRLARKAADEADAEVQVAGGLPPLSLSYQAELVPDAAEAGPIYESLARALEPFVDLYICETMSSIRESVTAVAAAQLVAADRGLPVFVAWTLDERPGFGLRSGESVREAWAALAEIGTDGFLFNCTHPDAIESAIVEMASLTDKPTGGYPNRFDVPHDWAGENARLRHRADFGTEQFVAAGLRWVGHGATVVGGCCRITPADIAAFSDRLGRN